MVSTNLYVLLLEENKYYVGMADDLGLRLWEHFKMGRKTGAAWTKKYRPVSVLHASKHQGSWQKLKQLEQQATLRLAKKQGFANVRGGGFSLTTDDYPAAWDEQLEQVTPADMTSMKPINASELKQMMRGKYAEWKEKRREAIEQPRQKRTEKSKESF